MDRKALLALAALAIMLPAPVSAGASDAYTELQDLAFKHISPAPLFPVSVPSAVSFDKSNVEIGYFGKKERVLRVVDRAKPKPTAVLALVNDHFGSLKAALREAKEKGDRISKIRVRGHKAYLFRRRFGVPLFNLTWVEDGSVYELETGTTKKISLKELRAAAERLEHLGREYIGSVYDRNQGDQSAIVVTTEKTVSADVTWSAACLLPDGTKGSAESSTSRIVLAPKKGNAFAFGAMSGSPWTAEISGTISPSAVSLQIHASATIGGLACDTGQVSLTAADRASD